MAYRLPGLGLLLVAATGSSLARAVRLAHPDHPTVEEDPCLFLRQESREDALPNDLKTFKRRWSCFKKHTNTSTPKGDLPKMVIGILAERNESEQAYRDVIRGTLMQSPLVCPLSEYDPTQTRKMEYCRVFVVFVEGRNTNDQSTATEWSSDQKDTLVLGIEENMNCGKTPAWFRFAANEYPWATHVAKMDMDTWIDAPGLMSAMRDFPKSCPHMYGGRSWSCPEEDFQWCPPKGCFKSRVSEVVDSLPTHDDFFQYKATPASADGSKCWSYMQGGFYFMSRELAAGVAEESGWWSTSSREYCHPEDVVAGHAVHKYGLEHDLCVAAMNIRFQNFMWHPRTHKEDSWRPARPPRTNATQRLIPRPQ